ncbi:hypothetical protein QYF61_016227 [Mycteria americana]|uniref:Uncharacterized protein n=1 Tax=Mycteria americana TaxID=33587 RepID=A0AAN7MYE0_MYCAM|nr:hypothetical protein QYF61_016217 [Mycteria americana]KAK4806377.1 hypothetical protein QYF61_016227 [Mycteria americana]
MHVGQTLGVLRLWRGQIATLDEGGALVLLDFCKAREEEEEESKPELKTLVGLASNGLDDGAECTLSKLADDSRLGGVALGPGGRAAVPRDLGRLERWAGRDLMQFSKGKCQGCCAADEQQHRLPRELKESPPLEMCHSPLDMVMDKRLQVALLEQGGGST